MKFFKNALLILLLLVTNSMNAKGMSTGTETPIAQPKPRPTIATTIPPVQPIMQAQSYAQALDAIKKMLSHKVVINNSLTREFINFVKSLNLSNIETKALLEAGANIHTAWTDNNEINKKILASLKNDIQTITQTKPIKEQTKPEHIKRVRPNKSVKQVIPTPVKPAEQKKRIAPAKKAEPIKPTPPIKQPVAPQRPTIKKSEPVKKAVPAEDRFVTNNVVMTLDPKKKETVETGSGSMVQQALVALYQKASPIIMTNNILEIIIKIKQQIGDQELQRLRTMGFQHMFNQAQVLSQKVNIPGINYLLVFLLSGIDFDAKNLSCYFHIADNLVLLIPKQYISVNAPHATNFNLNDQAKICGFNASVLTGVTDLTAHNLMQQIQAQKAKPAAEEKFIAHLTSMFTIQKKDGELIHPEQTSRWIVYLTGHGGPAHLIIGVVREQLAMMKAHLANPKRVHIIDPKTQRQLSTSTVASTAQQYEKMVQGRSGWQSSQLVPESSQIAGLLASDFAQLMAFFDNSIDTAYVHYVTCFAGGINQTFVNETLSALNVNFIASSQGIHEGYTSSGVKIEWDSRHGTRVTGQNFNEFFRLLRMFFTQQEEFVKIKGKGKDPILKILQTISSDIKPQNQPFVRFPGAGFFEAVPLDKSTKILTKVMVRAHEIEKKPIDVKSADIDVLIVNAPRIDVLLNLGKESASGHTALAFPSPQSFAPAYEAINVFKEINFEGSLQSFLFHCTYLNARMYPQTIVVNRLKGVLYQQSGLPNKQGIINNLIIHMKSVPGTNPGTFNQPVMQSMPLRPQEVKLGTIGENVQVCFEFGENIYQCMFAIKDFENPKNLSAYMQKLTFASQPVQSTNMNTVASNFLTSQEIAQLKKPITLKSITEFIDDKIDEQDPSMAIQSQADEKALLKFVKQHIKK